MELGQGGFPQELVDTLVKEANDGVIPAEETEETPAPVANARFSGRTVEEGTAIVAGPATLPRQDKPKALIAVDA